LGCGPGPGTGGYAGWGGDTGWLSNPVLFVTGDLFGGGFGELRGGGDVQGSIGTRLAFLKGTLAGESGFFAGFIF
jgi:hypothetical protein